MFNISVDKPVSNFAFLGTIVGYNFVKYDALARARKMRCETVDCFTEFFSLLE
jgi:hypothetical protein